MRNPLDGHLDRWILPVLERLVLDEPVVAIHGPRSVGKSTLLRAFAAGHGVEVIDLDDPAVRDAVVADPAFALSGPAPLCIDEYQKAPEILDALKARLNRTGSPTGDAVLTGSTRHDALPRTAQALTGRLHSLRLLPLSQGELDSTAEDFVRKLFHSTEDVVAAYPTSSTTRTSYIQRVCTGGFPLAAKRSATARARWFDDYVRLSIERDAVELARIRQRETLATVLDRLAGQTAQVLNVSAVASDVGADRGTVTDYVRLLEDLFLVQSLPAWGTTLRSRSTKLAKIHVVDSGLAARLNRTSEDRLATSLDPTSLTEFGHLLETFAVSEIRKQISWMADPVAVGHWRTSDGDEVDLVAEHDDGRVVAFEIKASQRVSGRDFGGLRKLRDSLGSRFVAGVAFSTGERSYEFEDRLYVMPIDRLWRPIDT